MTKPTKEEQMRPYYRMTDKNLTKLCQAGFELPDLFGSEEKKISHDDHVWVFVKLLKECADEAYIGIIKSYNNGLTHGETTWMIEDFEDHEERNYDNLADGLADNWIRGKNREDE